MTTRPLDAAVHAFTAELRESLPAIGTALDAAERNPGDTSSAQEAYRLIHALKGAASMVGLAALSHLLHLAEQRLEEPIARGAPVPDDAIALVQASLPRFAEYIDASAANRPLEEIASRLARVLGPDGTDHTSDDALRELVEIDRRELAAWEPQAAQAPAVEELPQPPAPVPGPPPTAAGDLELDLGPAAVAPELAEVFSQEAQDHLQTIARLTAQLSATPAAREPLQELRRAVHTLKGAAGVVGYKAASRLAHRMEDLLDRLYEGAETTPEATHVLAASSDLLDELITGSTDGSVLRPKIVGLFHEFDAVFAKAPRQDQVDQIAAPSIDVAPPAPSRVERRRTDRRRSEDGRGGGQLLRVPVQRVDDLVRTASELVINRSTFEQHHLGLVGQADELKFSAARLQRVVQRLESDYEVRALAGNLAGSGHDFDELEFDRYTEFHLLTRELAETASDIATIGARVGDTIGDFTADLARLGALTREIQDKTMEFRMVSLGTLTPRLERAVRVTAETCGKLVDFAVEGEQAALDKSLLEEMADPLLHLLRNAVDHGIEPVELRRARGKPERGRITVRAYHEGTEVVITVQDDGQGLDTERIRRVAIEKGLVGAAEAAALAPEALHPLVFEPGFTTASHVSEVSGRGVGMDVVKSKIARVNGRIDIVSAPGAGATMTVRVPMTMAITRVLVVRAGGETFGIPLGAVAQIVRPHPAAIGDVGNRRVMTLDGRTYPLYGLSDTLGLQRAPDTPATPPILLVNIGGSCVALSVDQIVNTRDAVVKSLGTHLRRVPGIWGATLLGDGTVILILNAADLLGAVERPRVRATPPRASVPGGRRAYTVLIVDDSLSMRHVLTAAVKRAGWEALQARDGLEALEIVHRAAPDLVLLDIEMPRMDGYEFLSAIRSQPPYASLPIVMLTSRGGEKHRQKAEALGATDYMVKPFHEDALIRNIDRLAGAARRSDAKAAS